MKKWIILLCALIHSFSLVFLVGCSKEGKKPEWVKKFGYDTNEIYSLKVGINGLPYLDGEIDQTKLKILFDTGNMSGVSVSPKIAKRLELNRVGELYKKNSAGKTIAKLPYYEPKVLSVFNFQLNTDSLYSLENNDQDANVGVEWLLDKRFTLDYQNKVIGIAKSSFSYNLDGDKLPIVWNNEFKGMLVVKGSINGHEVLIQLDTGKSRTCIDEEVVKNYSLANNIFGCKVDDIKLGSHQLSVKNARIKSFKGISQGYPEQIALGIGSDLLSEVIISVDYPNKTVIISKKI